MKTLLAVVCGMFIAEVVVAPSVEVHLVGVGYVLPSISVIEGQALNLTCHLANVSSPAFHWTSQADSTLSVAGPNLFIPQLRRHLAGNFSCNEPNHGSASVNVVVLYPPLQPIITGSRIIKRGSPVNYTCTSDSRPASTYTWSNDEKPGPGEILGTGPQFADSSFTESEYWAFCHAENTMLPTVGSPVTTTASNYFKTDVLRPAEVLGVPDQHVVPVGGTLDVTCFAIGKVYWTNTENKNFESYGNRLLIENIQKNFTGIYVCNTEQLLNPTYGEPETTRDEQAVYITVIDAPVSWRCYDFSKLEEDLLSNKVVMETDGVSAKQQLCENHPGFVFANKDSSLAPGCGQCYCCQPDKVIHPDCGNTATPQERPTTTSGHTGADANSGCESNTGVVVAAVVGWIVAVIAVVGFIFYFVRTKRSSQDTGVTELDVAPVNSAPAVPTTRWTPSSAREKPELPSPRKKKKESVHLYLEIDTPEPSTNDGTADKLRRFDYPAMGAATYVATRGDGSVSTATLAGIDKPGLSPTLSSDGYERPYASLSDVDTVTQNGTTTYKSLEDIDNLTQAQSQEPLHSPSGVTDA